jgi:hypothetical protein
MAIQNTLETRFVPGNLRDQDLNLASIVGSRRRPRQIRLRRTVDP